MKTYSPKDGTLTIGGVIVQSADSIKIMYNEDHVSIKVDPEGRVVRTLNHNRTARVEVVLPPSSPTNDAFSAMAIADRQRLTSGVGPVQFADLNSQTKAHASNAWVVKTPDLDRNKEYGSFTWIFECDEMEFSVGGLTR